MNEDGFHSFVTKYLVTEDYQKAIAYQTVTKCIKKAKILVNRRPSQNNKCNPIPLIAGLCVYGEFYKACPVEMQNQSENCVKLREIVDKASNRREGRREHEIPKPELDNNL